MGKICLKNMFGIFLCLKKCLNGMGFLYTYSRFSKTSPMNILFLCLENENMPFLKCKTDAWGTCMIVEQGDEVTRGHMKAHV